MSIGMRLDLRQSQQLVMTPQLQQAIKLLQMSNLELTGFLESEAEKNPLLEISYSDNNAAEPAPEPIADAPQTGDAGLVDGADPASINDAFETGHENLHDGSGPAASGPGRHQGGSAAAFDAGGPGIEDRFSRALNLREHLLAQIGQSHAAPSVVAVARYLVEELDLHGYLRTELEEIAERLNAPLEVAERALDLLQSCEPTGVGARSLGECLSLQLAEQGRLTLPLGRLLDNLDMLARGRHKPLRMLCEVDAATFTEMLGVIRELDPRPCADFDHDPPEIVIPDIFLNRTTWGGWALDLNGETLPKVLVNDTYAASLDTSGCEASRRFVIECQTSASWIVRSMEQRAQTILKVATEIVRQQEGFFLAGVSGLRPLTLRMIADAVGIHESTVSRVTSRKFIATDHGVFELKFFFTNAVQGTDGGDVASEAVRQRIKHMIDEEAADAVLSDDAIVLMLREKGVDIARRTVAKYRKSLRIPSSVERRRMKAITAAE